MAQLASCDLKCVEINHSLLALMLSSLCKNFLLIQDLNLHNGTIKILSMISVISNITIFMAVIARNVHSCVTQFVKPHT